MKKWKVAIYDIREQMLVNVFMEENSKFAVKKRTKLLFEQTRGADSYSITLVGEK